MTEITVRVFSDVRDLSQAAADLFDQITRQAVLARERFTSALSGGGTPSSLFHLLAESPYHESLSWEKMFFFWGDERCVPPDDAESNYYQAWQAWLGHVPVPEANILRARGELGPQPAAEDYARQLKSFADPGLEWPRFDLALMGLGADGHTASLFPGSAQTSGLATVAVSAQYQGRPANRVSLTPDVFNAARNVLFLAVGSEKSDAVSATLTGRREPDRLPAQRILPLDGKLWWFVDSAAASQLPERIKGVTIQRNYSRR
jgi:6-phosphogluconolactonase